MTLYISNLENTNPRDDKERLKKFKEIMLKKYYWASHGDQGKRISGILGDVDTDDEMEGLQKWVAHLDHELHFPVKAKVMDSEDDWTFKTGDNAVIKSLPHIVDLYGIIALIEINGLEYHFPLYDLEVVDETKAQCQLIDDYKIWFSNK